MTVIGYQSIKITKVLQASSEWRKDTNNWWRIPVNLDCGHTGFATLKEVKKGYVNYCCRCLLEPQKGEKP
jgi:hypothetical protein